MAKGLGWQGRDKTHFLLYVQVPLARTLVKLDFSNELRRKGERHDSGHRQGVRAYVPFTGSSLDSVEGQFGGLDYFLQGWCQFGTVRESHVPGSQFDFYFSRASAREQMSHKLID